MSQLAAGKSLLDSGAADDAPVGGRAEDAQADQTRFLERPVTGSHQLNPLSMAQPTGQSRQK
jgi:hypothetical protein